MNRLSRIVVLVSALLALGTTAYLSYGHSAVLPGAALAWLVLFLISGRFPDLAVSLVLAFVYVTPALLVLTMGRNVFSFVTLWLGGLAAIILRTTWHSEWSIPPAWRWALATVALTMAIGWPVVGLRELDFTLANAWNPRLPIAGVKIAGIAAVGAIAFTVATQLLGILWFDWLWARFESDRKALMRAVVLPLAAGVILSCLVSAYQGFVDVAFLSGHAWPSLRRATGTLMDANVFGMVAAMWGAAFLVIALSVEKIRAAVAAAAGLALTWIGVWTSGSRTAALVAVLGFAIAILSLTARAMRPRTLKVLALALASAVLLLVVIIATTRPQTITAIERNRYLMPSLSAESIVQTVRQLWARDGYGTTATAIIREFPWTGLGIGCFSMLVHDFGTEHGLDIPPDNAQNWLRQEIVELGVIGGVGWMAWFVLFIVALWPHRTTARGPAVSLRGPLVAFGMASMLGMPGQEPAIVTTFWLFAFWYAADTGVQAGSGQGRRVGWLSMAILALAYAVAHAFPGELRPPVRAARFGFFYTYGFFFDGPNQAHSAKHGVTVQPSPEKWIRLTVRAEHPDADREPIDADVWVAGRHVINRRLSRDIPLTQIVRVPGDQKRFVLEAKVDRTFSPSDYGRPGDQRDIGLTLSWEFLPRGPAR